MLAEFSIIPLGKGASLGDVAKVLKIIDNSKLPYRVNPMGTVVEGSWDEVMQLIKKCHTAALKNSERLVTNITIDDRKGRPKRIDEKVKSLEIRLGRTLKK